MTPTIEQLTDWQRLCQRCRTSSDIWHPDRFELAALSQQWFPELVEELIQRRGAGERADVSEAE